MILVSVSVWMKQGSPQSECQSSSTAEKRQIQGNTDEQRGTLGARCLNMTLFISINSTLTMRSSSTEMFQNSVDIAQQQWLHNIDQQHLSLKHHEEEPIQLSNQVTNNILERTHSHVLCLAQRHVNRTHLLLGLKLSTSQKPPQFT